MRKRIRHIRDIAKWWWALVGALWSTFWIADSIVAKWGSDSVKVWWDANTKNLPTDWQAWLIGLLVIAVFLILEGSYRHSQAAAKAAQEEVAALKEVVATLKEELRLERDRSQPHFVLSNGKVGAVPGQKALWDTFGPGIDAMGVFEIVVANIGAPSLTSGWECEVQHKDKSLKADIFVQVGTGKLTFEFVELSRADFIQEKSDITPISTGNRAVGWLLLIFKGITDHELLLAETTWRISCLDIRGAKWSFEYHPSGKPAQKLGYIPGGVIPTQRPQR